MTGVPENAAGGPFAPEIVDLSHRLGKVAAVDGFSLRVRAGKVVCLPGPSGCGETGVAAGQRIFNFRRRLGKKRPPRQ